MVAREGSAPSISGCRPDVILFHHRAKTVWMPRLDSHQDRRGQSPACCCYTMRQGLACRAVARRQRESPPAHFVLRRGSLRPSLRNGRRLVEPEVVATSPNRIKSPSQVSVLTIDTWRRSGVPGLGFIIKAFQQSRTVLHWSRNRIFRSPFRVQLQHTFPVLAICVKKIRTISGVEVPRSLVTLLALSSSGFFTRQRNSTVMLQLCWHFKRFQTSFHPTVRQNYAL